MHWRYFCQLDNLARLRYLINRTRRKLAWWKGRLINAPEDPQIATILENNRRVVTSFNPRELNCRLTLIRSRDHANVLFNLDRNMGWSGLALQGLEVHEIPANHNQLLKEPHVRKVSDVLRQCLQRVTDE